MKLNNLLSSDLPEIDESIKECINLGQWLLFKSKSKKHTSAVFYLKAGTSIFEVSKQGKVLKESKTRNISIDELYYFSDMPRPHSLSNASITQAR